MKSRAERAHLTLRFAIPQAAFNILAGASFTHEASPNVECQKMEAHPGVLTGEIIPGAHLKREAIARWSAAANGQEVGWV